MSERPTPETDSENDLQCELAAWELLAEARRERDEAREAILGWENKWRCAVDMAARAEIERDDAFNKLKELKDILR
jgi:hypothetical protein